MVDERPQAAPAPSTKKNKPKPPSLADAKEIGLKKEVANQQSQEMVL